MIDSNLKYRPAHMLSLRHYTVGLFMALAMVLMRLPLLAGAPGDLYPQGDVLCFTFYSTSEGDSSDALKEGATAIGPFYGDQARALSLAERLDTKLLYKVHPPAMRGWRPSNKNFVWPSDDLIRQQTLEIINAVKTNRHIAMWDVEPEELRAWIPAELRYLNVVTSVIHSNDPLRRPVYMYEPNHRSAKELARTIRCQDLCAKGSYTDAIGRGSFIHQRIWVRWSMEQELKAIADANPKAAPWVVLWMAADAAPGDLGLIRDWCRHDAYLGLVMGGKGIHVWSGFRGRNGFSDNDFQSYFDGYLSVARDLNGPLHLAPVFLYGRKRPEATMKITAGPPTLQLIYQGTNTYPSVTWLCAAYHGADYLVMVNSAEKPVTAEFGGLSAAKREDLFAGGSAPTPGGGFSVVLPPLAVKAFRFGEGTRAVTNSGTRSATPNPSLPTAAQPAATPHSSRPSSLNESS